MAFRHLYHRFEEESKLTPRIILSTAVVFDCPPLWMSLRQYCLSEYAHRRYLAKMAADLSVNKVVLLQVSSKLPGEPQGIISREKLKFQFLHINSFF